MSTFFTPCSVSGCPRNTAGYCYKCDPKPYFRDLSPKRAAGQGYQSGFQAGLKRAIELVREVYMKQIPDGAGHDASIEIEQAILKEADGEQY